MYSAVGGGVGAAASRPRPEHRVLPRRQCAAALGGELAIVRSRMSPRGLRHLPAAAGSGGESTSTGRPATFRRRARASAASERRPPGQWWSPLRRPAGLLWSGGRRRRRGFPPARPTSAAAASTPARTCPTSGGAFSTPVRRRVSGSARICSRAGRHGQEEVHVDVIIPRVRGEDDHLRASRDGRPGVHVREASKGSCSCSCREEARAPRPLAEGARGERRDEQVLGAAPAEGAKRLEQEAGGEPHGRCPASQ